MNTIKRGAVIWATAGALLLAWFGFAAGVNAGANDRASDESAQQEKIAHFYRVVAGDLSGQEPGPGNKLGRDLRELPEEGVDGFVGDSNRYGGISEDLGFDPFDGVGCSECGPLDREVALDVLDIKDGKLDAVLQRLEDEVEPADTMASPPGLLWTLWLVSLPLGVGALYTVRRRNEEDTYRGFEEERRILSQLQEAKGELPAGSNAAREIDNLANNLQKQIETRVSYKKSKTQEMKTERIMQEANDALDAIAAGNRTLN